MNRTILQSLLDAQVFTLPDNDDRLAQLEISATQLAKKLQENISDIPFYTLVALDPKITGTEPVIMEVEDVIKANWATLRSNRPESPISIIRSVILSTLYKIGTVNAYCSQIIYLTATNFYPYAVLNNEKEIVENILLSIGQFAEQNAIEKWALSENPPSLKLGSLKVSNSQVKIPTINKDELTKGVIAAIKSTNPTTNHTVAHGLNSSWGETFASELSKYVTNSVNTSFNSITFDSVSFEMSINKFFVDFKKSLDTELKSSFIAMQAVERRSRLLWWKETLYSQHLKKSYREIDKELRPIVMAFDLYNQLPQITPVSVDYLLRDTLYQLDNKTNEAVKICDILSVIENNPNKTLLQGCFNGPEIEDENRRITITDFIYLLVKEKKTTNELLDFTGIAPTKAVTSCDLAVMVLHDLLSNRIVES